MAPNYKKTFSSDFYISWIFNSLQSSRISLVPPLGLFGLTLDNVLPSITIKKAFPEEFSNKQQSIIDVSGIIEKFNVCATVAIIPRTKEINKAF